MSSFITFGFYLYFSDKVLTSFLDIVLTMNIRKLLTKDDYLVVLDTNCLLELYDYPYDFYVFANECLKTISNFIFLPSTVEIEFNYKHNQKFHNMLNGIRGVL